MSILSLIGISDAMAQASTAASEAAGPGSIFSAAMPMMIAAAVLFYFMIIRPQSKQSKEKNALLSELAVGDEILTIGGVAGSVKNITDEFVSLSISESVDINVMKSSVAKVLPKGTLKAIK